MRLLVASMFLLSTPAFAGSITASGEGHASAMPDFVSVLVDVKSQCYDSSAAASAANTKLNSEIKKALSAVINEKNKRDEVLSNQGSTSKSTVTEYDQANGKTVTLCTGWGVNSRLELKLADISKWPDLQDKLTQLIDANAAKGPQNSTVAAISGVSPNLYPETAKKISKEATAQALEDARDKADLARSTYGLCFVAFKSVNTDTGAASPRPYAEGARAAFAAGAPAGGGGRGVDLTFGPQWVHASASIEVETVACDKK